MDLEKIVKKAGVKVYDDLTYEELTGIIYEFITREKEGFCRENVKNLMNSTKDIK